MTRPRGGETGHQNIEIGVHVDVFLLVLIVDFHEVVVDDGHMTDIHGVVIQETMEGLRVAEFHHLVLLRRCPNLSHMEFNIILARAQSPVLYSILSYSSRMPSAPHTRGCTADV